MEDIAMSRIRNRMRISITRGVIAAAALLAVGCVPNPAESELSDNPEVWGYVASASSAQLEIEEKQQGVDELVVKRVLAPQDAWVVVHLDDNGAPGMRVGLAQVKKGESLDVRVELEEVGTEKVIVALHADRGTRGEFDFDMMAPTMSPDRPYFVDEKELAAVVTVREFGVPTPQGSAAVEVEDQAGARESLTVRRASAPADAWIVVHLDDDGMPGARVGLLHIPAGESRDAVVSLDPLPLTDRLFIAVHADRGEAGVFEFDMMNRVNSPDQPYFIDGAEVAVAASIR
jgi:hypothetical protein